MNADERTKARIQLAGMALQGMLERESSWPSKLVSDVFCKTLARHCVKLADAIIDEICAPEEENTVK